MDWIQIVIQAILTLLGTGGIGLLLFYRPNKQFKQAEANIKMQQVEAEKIKNELLQAEFWERTAREQHEFYLQACNEIDRKDAKIDELRKEVLLLKKQLLEQKEEISNLQKCVAKMNK